MFAAFVAACGGDSTGPRAVATVSVAPDSVDVITGASVQLAATVYDADGDVIEGREITWSSPDLGLVTVALSGSVIGLSPGRARIVATCAGKTDTSVVRVILPPVATVEVLPDSFDLGIDLTQQLTATLRRASGTIITGRLIEWTTSDADVATVSASGVVTAESPGRAVITATSEGKSDTAVVIAKIVPQDYSIVNVQWTQAIQIADGSVPMVLNGNGAAVNVLIASTVQSATPMKIVLRVFDAGGSLVSADTALTSGTITASPSMNAPTVQFRLAPSALVPQMKWQVVRDPQGLVTDADVANDVFPRVGTPTLSMVSVPSISIRFVPITLTVHNNTTGNVSAGNIAEYLRMVRSVHPLATITTTIGTPFSTNLSFGTPPTDGGNIATFWSPLLAQLDAARLADADPTVYWVGVVLPPNGFTYTNAGGMAYIPSSGSSSGSGTRTALVTSAGWASDPGFTRETTAHEMGHTFGRRHAPCGGPANPDPLYPYAGGIIGLTGFDVRGWVDGRSPVATVMSPGLGDIMSYCYPGAWISDYTYRGVLTFRGTVAAQRAAQIAAINAPIARSLIVRGTVDRGRVTLEPAQTNDARATKPERTAGRYRLEGRASDGRVLFAYNFEPAEIDHAPDTGHFAFAIPLGADIEAALATLEVRGPKNAASRRVK
ncbi:MAG TPA: Ig-like domain-containing protein [Gemmatimonadaceae bacterium]|nr:Ig-like domain-containing protein [Gemmatimonadaceae bacterium]